MTLELQQAGYAAIAGLQDSTFYRDKVAHNADSVTMLEHHSTVCMQVNTQKIIWLYELKLA